MPRAARPLIQTLRSFLRARQGATAVEFAFIAGPLLMLIFGATCADNLQVDDRTYDDFTSLRDDPAMTGGNFNPAQTCWSPGGPTDIVLVRTYYSWSIFITTNFKLS